MRKVFGWLLLLLGAFLLVFAVLAWTWLPDAVMRTPLNTDSYTYLSGSADKLNPATGEVENIPIAYTNHTTVDPKVSDDDVVAFVSTTCINIDENDPPMCLKKDDDRLVQNSISTFATDRRTALAVDNAKYLADGAEPYQGLVNKWPFNVEKKTYPYWDGTLNKAIDATYEGTRTINGLETYEFSADVPTTDAEILADTQGTYATEQSLWVDPLTGSIIDQNVHQVLKLPDGSTVLDISVKYTDETVKKNVDEAKSNGQLLNLLTKVLPWVALIVGLLSLVGGFLLLRGSRKGDDGSDGDQVADEPGPSGVA